MSCMLSLYKHLLTDIWLYMSVGKMVKFLTLNGNFEGLLLATELKQSSSETLDYMARLTWNCVLKSKWFVKSVLKRFGTLPKNLVHKI